MKLLKYTLSFVLVLQHYQVFAQQSSLKPLSGAVEILSKFKNSHDLTKHMLKAYKHDEARKEYLKKVLRRDPIKLPEFKVKKDKVYFSIDNKRHTFQLVKEGVYIVDGKKVKIDYKNEQFITLKKRSATTASLFNLLFYPEEAEAAVPMMLVYFAVVAGVLTVSFSCSGQNISRYFNVGDSFSSKTLRAQSARVRRMNNALNEAIASVVPFCAGAANASVEDLGLEYVNFDLAFQDYCDQLAENAVVRSANNPIIRPFNEEGEFNPRFENQLRDAAPVYNIGDSVTEYLENMTFELCSTPDCRDRNPQRVSYSELSETSQQILRAHFRNRNFSRSCVMDSFYRMERRNLRSYRDISEMTDEAEALE